ncbi:MAG: hypothetical protein NT080_09175 [Spirochaetes bacterium]|nr:hypothetical protein [Spirochaetota bacterium]
MEQSYLPLIPDPVPADNQSRSRDMTKKTGFAVSDADRRLIRDNAHYIREALFSCVTETQVECSVGFARCLSRAGINAENYWLFLRLVMTNNPWVIDELLHDREPRLLFSTILPNEELVETSFQALFSRHPEEIYPKALEALLGVVENAYFDPDDGFRLRRLSIMDINALGKFLLKAEPQDHPVNCLILDILDRLTHLGEYFQEPDKSVLSKHAFNVRFAYFDTTMNMVDAIPHPLLVRVPDANLAGPGDDFADLVAKRRLRSRDERGRFVRESEARAARRVEDESKAGRGEPAERQAAPAPVVEPLTPAARSVEQAGKAGKAAKGGTASPGTTNGAGRAAPRKRRRKPPRDA